jgi:hypothetical protein
MAQSVKQRPDIGRCDLFVVKQASLSNGFAHEVARMPDFYRLGFDADRSWPGKFADAFGAKLSGVA